MVNNICRHSREGDIKVLNVDVLKDRADGVEDSVGFDDAGLGQG